MSDSYLNFANTKFGAKLASMLGMPKPTRLDRYQPDQALISGPVILGSVSEGIMSAQLASLLNGLGAQTHICPAAGSEFDLAIHDPVKALVFDATELQCSEASTDLYRFFNQFARRVDKNGRIIVFGRSLESCETAEKQTVQRALEGFTRSLAKELRRGITVQLVYVDEGAEANTDSTLRFLLSAKSAYVSAQVIRVQATKTLDTPKDQNAPLAGKRALVTGASRGIGLAIAETLARDGAHVTCLDIPSVKDALETVAKRLNGSAITLDISADNAPKVICDAALEQGGWDIIVHNAGITRDKTIAKMPLTLWSQTIDINLSAQERINQAIVENNAINSGGRIICVSSISGIAGNRGQTNYAFSKAGVIGMVQAYAPRLAENNITINAVAPGFIETDMTAAMPFAVREAGRRLNSLSQGGHPVDVAESIAWFANPASSGLNGNVIRVCGQSLVGA